MKKHPNKPMTFYISVATSIFTGMFNNTAIAATQPVSSAETLADAQEKMLTHLENLLAYLPLLAVAAAIVVTATLLVLWIGHWQWPFNKMSGNGFLQNLFRQLTQLFVTGLAILLSLDILDATALVGAVLGTAGVVGLAIGFAFRDVVENYLAGVLLSLRRPFSPNDHISVDGHEGKIIRLTSRATILLTFDGNHVRIPNATVFKSSMTNYSRNPMRRFDFVIGVGTDQDLQSACALGIEALGAMKGVLDDPGPSVRMEPPGDSNIGLHFYAWVDQSKHSLGKVKSEAIRLVMYALGDAAIDMPEPIQRIRVEQLEGLASTPTQPKKAAMSATPAASRDALPEQDTSARDDIDAQLQEEQRAASDEDLLDTTTPEE